MVRFHHKGPVVVRNMCEAAKASAKPRSLSASAAPSQFSSGSGAQERIQAMGLINNRGPDTLGWGVCDWSGVKQHRIAQRTCLALLACKKAVWQKSGLEAPVALAYAATRLRFTGSL